MIHKAFIVILLLFFVNISLTTASFMLSEPKLNFTGLATKFGLPCEDFDVTTEDGYILKIFNIPGNKTKPILLMHGMADSADSYILRGHASIVYLLSNAGYDVWLSNYRGNRYSRRHVTLNPDTDTAFWDFSMHEYGLYDLSTSIDFILNKTKVNRLSLIGYSEGTVLMLILGSLRPEYNDKINIFIAWTPMCYLHNMVRKNVPFSQMLVPVLMPVLRAIMAGVKIEELGQDGSFVNVIATEFCSWYPTLCTFLLHYGVGYDGGGIEPDYLSLLSGYYPAGTSKKNLEHYLQVIESRRFAQFDYGTVKNLVKYNSRKPPLYNLRKVFVKVALFIGKNDKLSIQEDVAVLRKQLPNVVFYGIFEEMSHISFSQSRYSPKIVFPTVFKLLNQYA